MYDQGFSDGLPVMAPTPERVLRMLRGTRRDAQELVAVVPPNMAPATVEKVAINAVLAGCRPEYLPVVIASLEAVCTETFNGHGVMATTMGASPALIVNGPIRDRIGMNSRLGALGQGNRANATIGRALRLVLRNVGGAKPGGTERSTLGIAREVHVLVRGVGGAQPLDSAARRARLRPRAERRDRVPRRARPAHQHGPDIAQRRAARGQPCDVAAGDDASEVRGP